VGRKLRGKTLGAYGRVQTAACRREIDWRTAACELALGSLETVYEERAVYP